MKFIAIIALFVAIASSTHGQDSPPRFTDGKGLRFNYVAVKAAEPLPQEHVINVGSSEELSAALERVNPGDTVLLQSGVYFGSFEVRRHGTAEQPSTLRAESNEKNRTVITQADRALRENKTKDLWVKDGDLYYANHDRGGWPVRVLYDDVDLFPYTSVQDLRDLKTYVKPAWKRHRYPGPTHGMFWDREATPPRLYVRLKPEYGETNPNLRTMKVAPPAANYKATEPGGDKAFGIGFLSEGPAHWHIEGITFETTASCGVFIREGSGDVTVRNCFFNGIVWGVAGGNEWIEKTGSQEPESLRMTSRVIVEHCDYTQFPTVADAVEQVRRVHADPDIAQEKSSDGEMGPVVGEAPDGRNVDAFYWWRRKDGHNTFEDDPECSGEARSFKNIVTCYENGIVYGAGRDWVVRNNSLREVLDGLGSFASGYSINLRVHDNVVLRTLDNFIEFENHAIGLHVHNNLVIDSYEPFSYQTNNGRIWPTGGRVYQNVTAASREGEAYVASLPRRSLQNYTGVFKIMLRTQDNWWFEKQPRWLDWMKDVPRDRVSIPGGFAAYNNTLHHPQGNILCLGGMHDKLTDGFAFFNNLIYADDLSNNTRKGVPFALDGWTRRANVIVCGHRNPNPSKGHTELVSVVPSPTTPGYFVAAETRSTEESALEVFAGKGGRVLEKWDVLGLENPEALDFTPRSGSTLRGMGVTGLAGGASSDLPGIKTIVGALDREMNVWMTDILKRLQ